MYHAVDHVRRVLVRRRVNGLDAATLVDGDVHDHCARMHLRDVLATHELRRLGARNEHGADQQIAGRDLLEDVLPVRVDELHVRRHHVREIAQAVEVHVEHHDLRAHAGGHLRGVDADDAAAEDHDLRRRDAGHAAEQHAATAVELLEVLRAFLHGHPPRHLRHWREQRQLARRQLDRLVRDARRAAVDVCLRELLVGGEVEVREDRLPRAHATPLRGDGLLHLHDHLGRCPHRVRIGRDLGADRNVVGVPSPAPLSTST